MKTKILVTMAVTVLLAAGCSQNEITDMSPDARPAVGFSVYATPQTRGKVTDNSTIQNTTGFGVLAYYTGQSQWSNSSTFTPNFMYNQQVTYGSSVWTYSPVKYWPNKEDDKISFFAYAPYESSPANGTSNGVTLCENTKTGAPTLKFTLKTTPAALIDLVATNATQITHTTGTNQALNITKRTTAVAFKFDHILTRINFKAKLDAAPAADTHIFVTGMRLLGNGNNSGTTFYSSATYKFADGTWDYATATTAQPADYNIAGVMSLASHSSIVTGYATSGIKVTSITTGDALFKNNEYLFLIPPTNTAGVGADKVKVQIDYDIVTKDSKLSGGFSKTSTSATVSLPASTMALGKAYDYLFTIGLEKVQVSATVTGWDTESDVAIPSVVATATTIPTAIGTLNTTKGTNPNCNYFVVNVTGTVTSTLNLNTATVTNFVSGDQIEIKLPAATTVNSVTLPTGWKHTSGTGSVSSIIIKKN